MTLDRAVWLAWWMGTILLALGWLRLVPNFVGWLGFAITVVAVLVQVVMRKYWRLPPREESRDVTRDEADL